MNKKLFWVFALSSGVYFTQGIESLPSQGLFYYMKETLGFPAEKIMFIGSLTTLAWLVKPLIGYLIDNFLSKRTWIFISLFLDLVFVLFLGLIHMPLILLLVMLMINSSNAAFRDVAVDGIMCVEGKKYEATGRIQSVQWISALLAGLITGIGGAYVAEHWGYQAGFLCLIPVYLLVAVPAYFYQEDDAREEKRYLNVFSELKRLFSDKKLLLVCLFVFLYKYSPSFGTPLSFIERDVFKWSKMWIGTLGTISMFFGMLGALLYYKFSKRINLKKWLFYSVLVGALTTLSYLYYTPQSAVIYNILYSFLGMFIFIMILDLMARKSVKGFEATSFALLCSVNNLADVASNVSGGFLLPVIGLKWLIAISALTSFLCLPLINKIE